MSSHFFSFESQACHVINGMSNEFEHLTLFIYVIFLPTFTAFTFVFFDAPLYDKTLSTIRAQMITGHIGFPDVVIVTL